MSSWDTYAKTATPSEGGEYPDIDDGLYLVTLSDVKDPEERAGLFGMQTQFAIKWEFDDIVQSNGDLIWLWQYVTLPQNYLDKGKLEKKSNLFKLMDTLGFDMTSDSILVDPRDWHGTEARLQVVNRGTESDPTAIRPRIADVLARVSKKRPANAATATVKRQPQDTVQANGHSRLRQPQDTVRHTTAAAAEADDGFEEA